MTANKKSTTVNRLIDQALAIEEEEACDAGALGFMARAMVQATLPHRRVLSNEFERRNGAFTLSLMAPAKIGLPYGALPRLILAWLTTEAVKTQSRELELGESLSSFMRQLELLPTGGRWGSITRLKDQITRLFASTVSVSYIQPDKYAEMGYRLAQQSQLWWNAKDPEQTALWRSSVTLTESFFKEVTEHPIPVDMRAIQALKRSPMALDIYCWLTYRASYSTKPSLIPWSKLAMQFGCDYGRTRDFKASFLTEARKVAILYARARFETTHEGLIIKPSATHVRKRSTA
jgi:hypothetical protein